MKKIINVSKGVNTIVVKASDGDSKVIVERDNQVVFTSKVKGPHKFACKVSEGDYTISSGRSIEKIELEFRKQNIYESELYKKLKLEKMDSSKGVANPLIQKQLSLEEQKIKFLSRAKDASFSNRKIFLEDYEIQNAALGLYSAEKTDQIKRTIQAFREEYYRIEAEVNKATSVEDLQAIKINFPTKMVDEA